jgi:hypothetical protein
MKKEMQLQPGDRVRSKIFQPGICEQYEEGEVVRMVCSYIAVIDFMTTLAGIPVETLEKIN